MLKALLPYNRQFFFYSLMLILSSLFTLTPTPLHFFFFLNAISISLLFFHASTVTVITRSLCRICCCYNTFRIVVTSMDRANYIIYVCNLVVSLMLNGHTDTMKKYTEPLAQCEKLDERQSFHIDKDYRSPRYKYKAPET